MFVGSRSTVLCRRQHHNSLSSFGTPRVRAPMQQKYRMLVCTTQHNIWLAYEIFVVIGCCACARSVLVRHKTHPRNEQDCTPSGTPSHSTGKATHLNPLSCEVKCARWRCAEMYRHTCALLYLAEVGYTCRHNYRERKALNVRTDCISKLPVNTGFFARSSQIGPS
jgi:hypothetical protein